MQFQHEFGTIINHNTFFSNITEECTNPSSNNQHGKSLLHDHTYGICVKDEKYIYIFDLLVMRFGCGLLIIPYG
jgi:hypothetical protein